MITEKELQLWSVCATSVVSKAMLAQFKGGRHYVSAVLPVDMDALVWYLVAYFACDMLEDVEIAYPSTWVDAVKDRWWPEWAKRRWPPIFTRHHIKVADAYTDFPLPDKFGPCHRVMLHTTEHGAG